MTTCTGTFLTVVVCSLTSATVLAQSGQVPADALTGRAIKAVGYQVDELNQTLSPQRAESVRGYLVQQGLSSDSITSMGFGKTMPVADNGTAAGRQKNRRVELIVSGEVIGVEIGN
jgi:flagellar motor protein MotB